MSKKLQSFSGAATYNLFWRMWVQLPPVIFINNFLFGALFSLLGPKI